MHAKFYQRSNMVHFQSSKKINLEKTRQCCQQASMGCGTVRFDSQYVKVGVYSSREWGGKHWGGLRKRRSGGVVLHPLLSRESHHESTKSSEPSNETLGPFFKSYGKSQTLGQQRHPAQHNRYYTLLFLLPSLTCCLVNMLLLLE